jgi:hypothetical protein
METSTEAGQFHRSQAALILVLLTVAAGLSAWAVLRPPSAAGPTEAEMSSFQEQTGIRVIRVALTGGGGLVDLRYQVIDAEKAAVVHLEPPVLVDEDSGATIDTLFMGHSHGGDPKAGYSYPLLFVNEGGLLQAGGAVSVVVGDWRLEHVILR